MEKIKVICIKNYSDEYGSIEEGKIYQIVKLGRWKDRYYPILGEDSEGLIYGPAILDTEINNYFTPLADWREQQIDSILND